MRPSQINPIFKFDFIDGIQLRTRVMREFKLGDRESEYHRFALDVDLSHLLQLSADRLPDSYADLLDIALAVYFVDRCAPRVIKGDKRAPNQRWVRDLHISLPLRNPDRWHAADLSNELTALMWWMTEDTWHFDFRPRRYADSVRQPSLLRLLDRSQNKLPMLFSGGLDSISGLIAEGAKGNRGTIYPVSVVSSPRQQQRMNAVLRSAGNGIYGRRLSLSPIQVSVDILGPNTERRRDHKEPSHRSKAFLYLVLGSLVAQILGSSGLTLYENGIGALAIPMTADHVGPRATRAVHPRTLAMTHRVIELAIGKHSRIVNPGLFLTKAELVSWAARHLPNNQVLSKSFSCDRSSYLAEGVACGTCSSCHLRQLAFFESNIEDTQTLYDLPVGDIRSYPKSLHFSAMCNQAARIEHALRKPGTVHAALTEALGQPLQDVMSYIPLDPDEISAQLTLLLTRHVAEFRGFEASLKRSAVPSQANVGEKPYVNYQPHASWT